MKFCPECNSILHYVEDEGVLKEKCRSCTYINECDVRIIDTMEYKQKGSLMENKTYYIYDPTLPRTTKKECPNKDCPSRDNKMIQEAVFYSNDKTMKLIYICVVCNTEWSYS